MMGFIFLRLLKQKWKRIEEAPDFFSYFCIPWCRQTRVEKAAAGWVCKESTTDRSHSLSQWLLTKLMHKKESCSTRRDSKYLRISWFIPNEFGIPILKIKQSLALEFSLLNPKALSMM